MLCLSRLNSDLGSRLAGSGCRVSLFALPKSGTGAENCPREPEIGADMPVNGRAAGDAGFTLIDMLFVIALIGTLSTLAIPGLMRARGAAQASSAIGSLRVINS